MQSSSTIKRHLNQGFTLVELLIVVIILAILAAIVVPQFASSTDDAKISAAKSTLSNLRGAIDLYYQQHGKYPAAVASSGGSCPGTGGTASTGAVDTVAALQDQLGLYTDASGKACSTSDTNYKFGPYLKKATLPAEPISGIATVEMVTGASAGNLNMNGTGTAGGWKYDNKTGKIIINSTKSDSDNIGYDKY